MAAWDSGLTDAVRAASAAASDPSLWGTVLDALCNRFGATAAAIQTPHGAPAGRPLFVDVGLPQHTVPDYIDYWSPEDPWFAGSASKQIASRAGECGIGSELCDWGELKKLDYYQEFAAPIGIQGLLAMMVDDGSRPSSAPLTLIGLYRRPGLDEFTYEDKRAFEAVHAPLQLAFHSHWSFIRSGLADQARMDAFALVPKPLLVLSRSGAVLYANPLGQALLSKGEWVGVHHGKVQRLGQLGREAVQATLRAVEGGFVQTHPLFGPPPAQRTSPAIARLVPLSQDNTCRLTWPSAAVLLMIDEPESDHREQQLAAFASQYRLTKAELQLAAGLAEGGRLSEIAQRHEVSIHTLRVHLQNIFGKMGVRRQSDLIRVVGAFLR